MLRRDRQIRTQLYQLRDAALFAVGLWLAHLWRVAFTGQYLGITFEPIAEFGRFIWLYVIIIPGVPLVLETQGFYLRPIFASRKETAWTLGKACIIVVVGVILVMFLLRIELARGVIILFGMISFVLVMLAEEILRVIYQSRFGQAQMRRGVILVGAPEDTRRMRADFGGSRSESMEVLAELDLNERTIADLVELLHQTSANGIIINAKHVFFGQVEKAIQACEIEGVEAWLVADFFKTQVSRTALDDFQGRPVLVFRSAPEASWQGVFKQALDLSVAFLLILLLLPVWLLVPIAIRLSSPGPVLFRQRRCGLNGAPFTMLKFRSMVSNAEQLKQELAALNEMGGPVFKVTNDPRVTKIGRLLRKYSIDEVPQLFNVLRGEMSLVGPRPLPVDEVRRFDDPAHRRRLSVKPGITGEWQAGGRNTISSFEEWVAMDLRYIDNWSLWLDLKIILKTIPAVLFSKGAK